MENNKYRLQIRSHKELFPTKEAAISYLETGRDCFLNTAKFGEPALVFYGDDPDSPKMLVAVGSTIPDNGRLSLSYIDDSELREMISHVEEELGSSSEEVERLKEKTEKLDDMLMDVVGATGLTYDPNKIEDQITYEPEDRRDPIIGDAETLAKAVALLSERIQDVASEAATSVEDTTTVAMSKNADGVISSEVKICSIDTNNQGFDNNMIGSVDAGENGGIYAAVDLSYDTASKKLRFSRSGVENGVFKTDANVKEFDLDFGEHTVIGVDNGGNTVELAVNEDNGVQKISGNVRLSGKNSIQKDGDGGLFVDASISVNENNDSLIFRLGNTETVVNLPGAGVFDRAEYDSANNAIKLYFLDGETITIPLGNVFDNINRVAVDNKPSDSVTLSIVSEDGKDTLSADTKVAVSPKQLIEKNPDNGNLIVSSDVVATNESVSSEIDTAKSELISSIHEVSDKVDTTKNELETKIHTVEDSVTETNRSVETLSDRVSSIENDGATDAELATKADKSYVDSNFVKKSDVLTEVSNTSENPVQSRVLSQKLGEIGDGMAATNESLETVRQQLDAAYSNLNSRVSTNETTLSDGITIDKVSELVYALKINGVEKGRINLPKDQFFESASYDAGNNEIVLVFFTNNGEGESVRQEVRIPVGDLVDTYNAGDGLSLSDNTFSVKLNSQNESEYLKVSDGGLMLTGVSAIKSLVDNMSGVIDNISETLANKADKTFVESSLEGKQDTLNGSDTVSIDNRTLNVKVASNSDTRQDNMIRVVDGEGLYANVTIRVDKEANKLYYRTSGTEGEYSVELPEMPGVSVVKSASYDPVTKKLTIIFDTGAGGEGTPIVIDMTSLVADIDDKVDAINDKVDSLRIPIDNFYGGAVKTVTPGSISVNSSEAFGIDASRLVSNDAVSNNCIAYDPNVNGLYVEDKWSEKINGFDARISALEASIENFIGGYSDKIDKMWKTLYGENGNPSNPETNSLVYNLYNNLLDFNDTTGNWVVDDEDTVHTSDGEVF